MSKKKSKKLHFTDLSLADMNDWAGPKIVARGTQYKKEGRVKNLAITEEGSLVAWVEGTDRYATVVMETDDLPESYCSCPYEIDCKHAIAVVLEYQEMLSKRKKVPLAKEDDPRIELTDADHIEDDYDYDDDENEEEYDDDDYNYSNLLRPVKLPKKNSIKKQELESLLKRKTKADLIDMIWEYSKKYPDIARSFNDQYQYSAGNIKKLVSSLRSEIKNVTSEPAYSSHWGDPGFIPDYSGICTRLENMLDAGYPDEVLSLGEELIRRGIKQVEMSDDEGETGMEIESCIPVILQALDKSSREVTQKINWVIDTLQIDDFGIIDELHDFLQKKHPKAAWSEVATQLMNELEANQFACNPTNWSERRHRNYRSGMAILALENAGRTDEIIPLCIQEAPITKSYERLAKYLIDDKRYEEAHAWIDKGIEDIGNQWPGTVSNLRKLKKEIFSHQKNWKTVALMTTVTFVEDHWGENFKQCQKDGKKARVWPAMQKCLMHYMETGRLPWDQKEWPLEEPGPEAPGTIDKTQFPMYDNLINIAIQEKKPEDIIHWLDQYEKDKRNKHHLNLDRIAKAIDKHAPLRAVSIWQKLAESRIAEVKPSAYMEAGEYLQNAAKVMVREKKRKQWDQYLDELRTRHKRKTRLMEVLNIVESKANR